MSMSRIAFIAASGAFAERDDAVRARTAAVREARES